MDYQSLSAQMIRLISVLTLSIVECYFTAFNGSPNRSWMISKNREVRIGRASKIRDPSAVPRYNNGWIDSPVLSRDHAVLMIGPSADAPLLIRDEGSTHGTSVNGQKLTSRMSRALHKSDVIVLGAPIRTGRGKPGKLLPCDFPSL